jgi:hypothetical protein
MVMGGSPAGHRPDDEDDLEEGLEPASGLPHPSSGEGVPFSEFDDFDEEDFDDEFDDDFEEELEDEYELAEFEQLTEEDLAEADEEVDVAAIGDFVDEDAEPEEEPVALEESAEEEEEEEEASAGRRKSRSRRSDEEEDEEEEEEEEDDELDDLDEEDVD